jgi:hypothetical protein
MTKGSQSRIKRRRANLPPERNVAFFKIDHEEKKFIVVTKDYLINQLRRDGPKIARSFDRLIKDDLNATGELLAQVSGLLRHHLRRLGDDDIQAISARLLANAMSSFIASVEVARHGFRRQYGSVARPVIEALTTILYLQLEEGSLDLFLAGKLNSTKTISKAKGVLPPIGWLYGLLSNEFVHIGPNHAKFEPVLEYQEVDEALKFIGAMMRGNAWLIYVVAELVFHKDVERPRYWRSHGGGRFEYAPSEREMTWLKEFFDKYSDEEDTPNKGS